MDGWLICFIWVSEKMDKIPPKRVRRYLHYEEYVVDLDLSGYSEDEVIEMKAVHDALNSVITNLPGLLKEICAFLQLVANDQMIFP